nr:PREDICTED: group 3 secretory phospholipase A2 [Latimeria chalumnae]|eukprot:XP_005990344.1 PREDICTED: group 3 secretory phospholipase A2 [Latimeria chalumnae]
MFLGSALPFSFLLVLNGVVFAHLGGQFNSQSDYEKQKVFCYLLVANSSQLEVRYLSFLRVLSEEDLVLFQTTWDSSGNLLQCSSTAAPNIIDAYQSFCREGLQKNSTGHFRKTLSPDLLENVQHLEHHKSLCTHSDMKHFRWESETPLRKKRSKDDDGQEGAAEAVLSMGEEANTQERETTGTQRRTKRWTIPGTLWCGAGDVAENFTQLGVFDKTDLCCRDHDHCSYRLSAFEYNYGTRNYRLHTVSHCDCDYRFKHCLLNLNDSISTFVGISFFNLLEVPCFVLEQRPQCTERDWLGRCTKHEMVPFATFRQQGSYNYTHPFQDELDVAYRAKWTKGAKELHSFEIQSTTLTAPTDRSSMAPVLEQGRENELDQGTEVGQKNSNETLPIWGKDKKNSDNIDRENGLRVNETLAAKDPVGASKHKGPDSGGDQLLTNQQILHPAVPASSGSVNRSHMQNANSSSDHSLNLMKGELKHHYLSKSCGCYKRLDQCEYKIAPRENKFEMQNLGLKTLYHCNCTKRLARRLRKVTELNEVEVVASKFVSLWCFELKPVEMCKEGGGCTKSNKAFLTKAKHLQRAIKSKSHMGPQKFSLKVKREGKEARESQLAPLKLYDECLQIVRASRRED